MVFGCQDLDPLSLIADMASRGQTTIHALQQKISTNNGDRRKGIKYCCSFDERMHLAIDVIFPSRC